MTKKDIEWATHFPNMDAHPTKDPRIFQTPWKKEGTDNYSLNGVKKKLFFCGVADTGGNNCYGVEVVRKLGVDATKECHSAFAKVKVAIYDYEDKGVWPQDSPKKSERS